jgi:hypothetical protein
MQTSPIAYGEPRAVGDVGSSCTKPEALMRTQARPVHKGNGRKQKFSERTVLSLRNNALSLGLSARMWQDSRHLRRD